MLLESIDFYYFDFSCIGLEFKLLRICESMIDLMFSNYIRKYNKNIIAQILFLNPSFITEQELRITIPVLYSY